jgi:hypothetical protein
MKRIITFLILIRCFSFSFGQTHLCINGGINYSWLPVPGDFYHAQIDRKYSYSFGASIKITLVKNLDLSIGLMYNNYRAHIIGSEDSKYFQSEDFDLTIGYASLTILPEYSIGNKKLFFVNGGFHFSALVHSRKEGTYKSYVVNGSQYEGELAGTARNLYEFIDIGLTGGAGMRLKPGKGFCILPQIRFNYGIGQIKSGCFLIEIEF